MTVDAALPEGGTDGTDGVRLGAEGVAFAAVRGLEVVLRLDGSADRGGIADPIGTVGPGTVELGPVLVGGVVALGVVPGLRTGFQPVTPPFSRGDVGGLGADGDAFAMVSFSRLRALG